MVAGKGVPTAVKVVGHHEEVVDEPMYDETTKHADDILEAASRDE